VASDLAGWLWRVALVQVLSTACGSQPPPMPSAPPTPQGDDQAFFDAAVDCSDEIYRWGRLEKVASVFSADEPTIPEVAETLMTFPAGIKDTSRLALEGCSEALERGLRRIQRAEESAWKPWGLRKTWLNYHHYVYFCYRLFREEGDIYRVAARIKTRTATASAIAREFAEDPYPVYYESTYEGCLDGLSQGQLDKSLGLFDGPQI
jgi:hypothetical protein